MYKNGNSITWVQTVFVEAALAPLPQQIPRLTERVAKKSIVR